MHPKELERRFRHLEKYTDYIQSKIPKEVKHKNGVPTVIMYEGRRYVLFNENTTYKATPKG